MTAGETSQPINAASSASVPVPNHPLTLRRGQLLGRSAWWPQTWASLRPFFSWLLPVVAFGAIAIDRWRLFGPFVTGLDPGNWFALGRGFFGDGGRSTAGTYPPLVPMALHLVRLATDPMTAAKVVGVASVLAVMLASYAVARHAMGAWFAVAAASSTVLAGVVVEQLAFGGYPQNYALALLVLAAFAAARFLASGARSWLLGAVATLAGTALSHHMYFALTCLAVAVVWGIWLTTRPDHGAILRRTAGIAGAGAVALVCFTPTFLALRAAGYEAPINAGRLELVSAFREGIRGTSWLWLPIFVAGISYLLLTTRRRHVAAWQVAAATMTISALSFPATAEPRLLPPLVIGASLATGLALQDLWRAARHTPWGAVPPIVAATIPILLLVAPPAVATTNARFDEERQIDRSFLNTAAFVEQHHSDGVVVVHQNRDDWPIGWWFEGLTHARIAVGSYEEGIAFPEERANVRLVNRFFDRQLTTRQVAALAAHHDVDLLVFRKWEWIGWLDWLAEPAPALAVLYDDGTFMILDVRPR